MAEVISGNVFPTDKLQRFGYITLKSGKESMLSKSGEYIRAHEFHYWDSTNSGEDYTAEKTDGRTWKCCHSSDCFYAGFPHLYFYTDIKIAERFVEECIKFGERNG
jgi:cobyrinic acid a,c-diamide synthase